MRGSGHQHPSLRARWRGEPDLSKTPFAPRSKVLLEGQPIEFESDDEDGGSSKRLHSQRIKPDDVSTTNFHEGDASEVAYSQGGSIESVHLDRERIVAAVQSLPTDTWASLLNDDDRRRLCEFLPSLQGWENLINDEAQRHNVAALLSGDNFMFGNPLRQFSQGLHNGRYTVQVETARCSADQLGRKQFDSHRHAAMRSTLVAFKRRQERSKSPGDEQPTKKLRLDAGLAFIQRATPSGELPLTTTAVVSKQASIFLTMRSILLEKPLTSRDVCAQLNASYPQCSKAMIDFPIVLSFQAFVDAALDFLSHPEAREEGTTTEYSELSLVRFHEASGVYEWIGARGDMESVPRQELEAVLMLEQIFRAPIPKASIDLSKDSSAVRATRRRREASLIQQARQKLLEDDPTFADVEALSTSHPSLILKRSLVPQDSKPSAQDHRDYHAQETQRYKKADSPFIYVCGSVHSVVGSVIRESHLVGLDEKLLVPTAPASVNIVSLVYDACACLRNSRGTRADVTTNFRRSKFLKPDASDTDIDEAVVQAINVLAQRELPGPQSPCIFFDATQCCWKYQHSQKEWPQAVALAADHPAADGHPSTPATSTKMSMKDLLH